MSLNTLYSEDLRASNTRPPVVATSSFIPVFMVLFGEANEAALKELVATTGGRVFDARKSSLYSVMAIASACVCYW